LLENEPSTSALMARFDTPNRSTRSRGLPLESEPSTSALMARLF